MDNSLIDLGKLAEPAKILIERVSDAVGAFCRPYQMKRIARAEVEVEKIKRIGELELKEEENRAIQRMIKIETKKLYNIESITVKAIDYLNENSNPKEVDSDWLDYFFTQCEIVSDEQMQQVWAKILAQECNSSGLFSKRTLDVVRVFEKDEAEYFTKLCRFKAEFLDTTEPLIFNPKESIYEENGITFSVLNHFASIGLITFDPISGYVYKPEEKNVCIKYFDKVYNLELPSNAYKLEIGKVLFTSIGKELSQISGAEPIEGFEHYLENKFAKYLK